MTRFTDPAFISSHIPHRPPFLWLDRVVSLTDDELVAEKEFPAELALFAGHYPDRPLVPGVILCEAAFQAGALLIAVLASPDDQDAMAGKIPVLTRINGAKFKRQVGPGDLVTITVSLKERLSQAWFSKGVVRIGCKVAVKVDFACAAADE